MKFHIRDARPSDTHLLEYWDTLPHIIAADPSGNEAWEEELKASYDWREQWIAEVNSTPIGYLQIIDPAEEISNYWQLKENGFRAIDIWIGPPEYLNRGFGTKMMNEAITWCLEQDNVHTILIDPLKSNTDAHRFYQRLGFEPVDERWFGNDLCLVHHLKLRS